MAGHIAGSMWRDQSGGIGVATVFYSDRASRSVVKAYRVDKEHRADISVYLVDREHQAKGDALWFVVDRDYKAKWHTSYPFQQNL